MIRSRMLKEPFRLFFILGVFVGILGVGIWPLYYWGYLAEISGVTHARFQIQGFLGLFVVGFLLTALPRLLGVSPCTLVELLVLFFLFCLNLIGHWMHVPLFGDIAFLMILIQIGVFVWLRFSQRKDLPPPFFGFVLIGMLHAAIGTALLICSEMNWVGMSFLVLGQNLLYQGFLLCLILGIGSFLAPRIMGVSPEVEFPESRAPLPGWWTEMLLHSGVGLMIFLSFWLELSRWQWIGQWLRAALATWIMWKPMRIHLPPKTHGFMPKSMRFSLILILVGLWILPLFPEHHIAALHVLFIGGFGLITFVVATRVTLGHSGFECLLNSRLLHLASITGFFLLSMLFRWMADFNSERFFLFLTLGAMFWITGALTWSTLHFQKLLFPKTDQENTC